MIKKLYDDINKKQAEAELCQVIILGEAPTENSLMGGGG